MNLLTEDAMMEKIFPSAPNLPFSGTSMRLSNSVERTPDQISSFMSKTQAKACGYQNSGNVITRSLSAVFAPFCGSNRVNRDYSISPKPRGVTLVELLVVMTIVAVFAAISFPVLQIIQQRDKESRLLEILSKVRTSGIGLGKPVAAMADIEASSDGYRNFVLKKLFAQQGGPPYNHPPYSLDEVKHAIASGIEMGDIYPLNPQKLLFALNYVATFAIDDVGGKMYATITQRFISNLPPHPFKSWMQNAHWEFKAATDTDAKGPWFIASFPEFPESASLTPGPNVGWWTSTTKATGVINIRSAGAGFSLAASDTESW